MILCGESAYNEETGYYEFQWYHEWHKVTTNTNGTTGWATILHSTNAAVLPKTIRRIHLCAFNPCLAWHTASKYGSVGPPMHLQKVEKREAPSAVAAPASGETVVAEPSASLPASGETAVAEPLDAPSLELASEEPVLVESVGPAPVEQPCVGSPEVHAELAEAPDCPTEASLQTMTAPAPTQHITIPSKGAANATDTASTAVAAQHNVKATLLALAREIRKPRTYVGYSAFILMGLVKKCQPCVWEGASFIDLLEVFAPWAKDACTAPALVSAIPVALVSEPSGSAALAPICAEYPLHKTCHFVAGIRIPECEVLENACSFETLYASLGVGVVPSVMDGDCALDVMTMMLGIPSSESARANLRLDISDYLRDRIDEPWLHDIMVACQELSHEDVELSKHVTAPKTKHAPTEPSPAVADLAIAAVVEAPDEETFAAMQWASKLEDDSCVLSLIRSLPKHVVEEQVSLYRQRDETAVAVAQGPTRKISVGPRARFHTRMTVAHRFHTFCQSRDIVVNERLPRGAVKTFTTDHLIWSSAKTDLQAKTLRQWHDTWRKTSQGVVAAVAGEDNELVSVSKNKLGSRAPVPMTARQRAPGAGRKFAAPILRQALYEWFVGIRYAIDWTQMIAENRSRGKKHLARFPRAVLRLKMQQLLQDYTYASLLNGELVVSFKPDSQWFKRWEEEYGLSMRMANRKYAVPRHIVKERLEIFWVVLFRVRLFIALVFGYDALILNFDQSPYHHNETGSQNKPTLAIRGSIVPVVEGNSDVKSRWTANLTTQSVFTGSSGGPMPAVECMFKAEKDGIVHERLQAYHRSRGFPEWFSVTVGPKGSYREYDIIAWLEKHLETWKDGRDWRIYLCDDYSCHKTDNVWNLCWSRGYIRLTHGGGVTPVAQTPDTDLNEHVRRAYAQKESRLLLEKMKNGQVVPKVTHEECLDLMFSVVKDPALHIAASSGYKKVGQSIDLYGKEDMLVCREAGTFWNEETTDKFPSMRAKIDSELAAVAD